MASNPPSPPAQAGPQKLSPEEMAKRDRKRKRLLLIVGTVFAVIGLGWLCWHLLVGQWYESTDDAYVNGNVVQVTPQVAGTVISIAADDTDRVQQGQLLVELDGADARVALQEAEANLAHAVRQVRTLFATSGQAGAAVEQRQSELERAQADLERRKRIAAIGAVSREELQHAQDAVTAAEAAVRAAREQHSANRAMIDRTTIADHPDVLAAAAKVHEAFLAESRTRIQAPVAGVVARRSAQVGQRVTAGNPLMSIVPIGNIWVDANFKESQLRQLRLGQPAKIEADLYGRHAAYRGRIVGFGAGTGAAFALLPAQNATGNWIKVVQRVPVRIALDPDEVREFPLQVGLSMQVEVDTHSRDGERLPQAGTPSVPKQQTDVFDGGSAAAEARVAEIIERNSGNAPGNGGQAR